MSAWVGLGSNLGNPARQIGEALERIASHAEMTLLRCSSFYQTPPWGDTDQDDFINAVAEIETGLAPYELLEQLQVIECQMGRRRDQRRWGPRVIDLDLLLYGDLQLQSEELQIPHPRLHQRAFVLVPLGELDDALTIPGHGEVRKLLAMLDLTDIVRVGVMSNGAQAD